MACIGLVSMRVRYGEEKHVDVVVSGLLGHLNVQQEGPYPQPCELVQLEMCSTQNEHFNTYVCY